jgi:hypothetical protein
MLQVDWFFSIISIWKVKRLNTNVNSNEHTIQIKNTGQFASNHGLVSLMLSKLKIPYY